MIYGSDFNNQDDSKRKNKQFFFANRIKTLLFFFSIDTVSFYFFFYYYISSLLLIQVKMKQKKIQTIYLICEVLEALIMGKKRVAVFSCFFYRRQSSENYYIVKIFFFNNQIMKHIQKSSWKKINLKRNEKKKKIAFIKINSRRDSQFLLFVFTINTERK